MRSLPVGLLFRRVQAEVLAVTNGAQRPHDYHSQVGEHYLTRTLPTGASVTVTAAAPAESAPANPPRPDPSAPAEQGHALVRLPSASCTPEVAG